MIKAFAFDLDGLLVDSEPLWEKTSTEIMKSFGMEWDSNDQELTTGISVIKCAEYMCKKTRSSISILEMKDKLVDNMVSLLEDGIKPMEGANDILELTSQFPKAIASSSPIIIIRKVIKKMGWEKHFDFIVSGDEIKDGKPAPDIYLFVCKGFNIQPENLIVFEDSANGVLSAIKARTRCVCVKSPIISPPVEILKKADLVLNSLNEFTLDMLEFY